VNQSDKSLHDQIKSDIYDKSFMEDYKSFIKDKKLNSKLRKAQYSTGISIAAAVISAFLIFTPNSTNPSIWVISGIMGIVSLGVVILKYLEPSESKSSETLSSNSTSTASHLEKQLHDMRMLIASLQNKEAGSISQEDKEKITQNIQTKLESEALADYVDGIKQLIKSQTEEKILDHQFKAITARLETEATNLAKRGNLNLFLGMCTTLLGLGALAYSVYHSPLTQSPQELIVYFIPRISLVLLIEVFAYFFLSLYKQSLGEIKYFQNEITNIQAKQLAVSLTTPRGDNTLISKVADSLATTERNFILTKDQTTLELERERINSQTNSSIINNLKEILTTKRQQ